MRKKILLLLISVLIFSPSPVRAARHYLEEIDMSIYFDETQWYVFTKENLDNNVELDNLDISKEELITFFDESNAKLMAFLLLKDENYNGMELYIDAQEDREGIDLRELTDLEVKLFLNDSIRLSEESGIEILKSGIYKTKYPFAWMEYEMDNIHMLYYFTIINGRSYDITIQKSQDITAENHNQIIEILDTIDFGLNDDDIPKDGDAHISDQRPNGSGDSSSIANPKIPIDNNIESSEQEESLKWSKPIAYILLGTFALVLISYFIYSILKIKKKRLNSSNEFEQTKEE